MRLRTATWTGALLCALGSAAVGQETWTSRNPLPTTGEMASVVWTGTQLVAVGQGILTSPDGTTWTQQRTPTSRGLSEVTWTGTQLVAV